MQVPVVLQRSQMRVLLGQEDLISRQLVSGQQAADKSDGGLKD